MSRGDQNWSVPSHRFSPGFEPDIKADDTSRALSPDTSKEGSEYFSFGTILNSRDIHDESTSQVMQRRVRNEPSTRLVDILGRNPESFDHGTEYACAAAVASAQNVPRRLEPWAFFKEQSPAPSQPSLEVLGQGGYQGAKSAATNVKQIQRNIQRDSFHYGPPPSLHQTRKSGALKGAVNAFNVDFEDEEEVPDVDTQPPLAPERLVEISETRAMTGIYEATPPPVDAAKMEKYMQEQRQAAAIAMARVMIKSVKDGDLQSIELAALHSRPVGLHRTARELAEEVVRTAPDYGAEMQKWYLADEEPPAPKRHVGFPYWTLMPKILYREDDDRASIKSLDSDDFEASVRRRHDLPMRRDLPPAEAERRQRDRESLLQTARENVNRTIGEVDEEVYLKTGKTSHILEKDWHRHTTRMGFMTHEEQDETGLVPIAEGKAVEEDAVNQLARERVQPQLEEMDRDVAERADPNTDDAITLQKRIDETLHKPQGIFDRIKRFFRVTKKNGPVSTDGEESEDDDVLAHGAATTDEDDESAISEPEDEPQADSPKLGKHKRFGFSKWFAMKKKQHEELQRKKWGKQPAQSAEQEEHDGEETTSPQRDKTGDEAYPSAEHDVAKEIYNDEPEEYEGPSRQGPSPREPSPQAQEPEEPEAQAHGAALDKIEEEKPDDAEHEPQEQSDETGPTVLHTTKRTEPDPSPEEPPAELSEEEVENAPSALNKSKFIEKL